MGQFFSPRKRHSHDLFSRTSLQIGAITSTICPSSCSRKWDWAKENDRRFKTKNSLETSQFVDQSRATRSLWTNPGPPGVCGPIQGQPGVCKYPQKYGANFRDSTEVQSGRNQSFFVLKLVRSVYVTFMTLTHHNHLHASCSCHATSYHLRQASGKSLIDKVCAANR